MPLHAILFPFGHPHGEIVQPRENLHEVCTWTGSFFESVIESGYPLNQRIIGSQRRERV